MELTSISVKKKNVDMVATGEWNVTMTVTGVNVVGEGEEEITTTLFSKDFSETYRTGDNVNIVLLGFKTQMQEFIDKWTSENTLFNSTALDNAVTTIQNELTI